MMPGCIAEISRTLHGESSRKGLALREFRRLVSDLSCNKRKHFELMSGFLIYDKHKPKIFHVKQTQNSVTESTRSLFQTTMMVR